MGTSILVDARTAFQIRDKLFFMDEIDGLIRVVGYPIALRRLAPFVVLVESVGRVVPTEDFMTNPDLKGLRECRDDLISQGLLVDMGNGQLKAVANIQFSSASQAAGVMRGSAANGWERFENARGSLGKVIAEFKRRGLGGCEWLEVDVSTESEKEVWRLELPGGLWAEGYFREDGKFVLMKDSLAWADERHYTSKSISGRRKELRRKGLLEEMPGGIYLKATDDIIFDSMGKASDTVIGAHFYTGTVWRNRNNVTYKEWAAEGGNED